MPVQSGAVTFARFRSEPTTKRPSDTRRWLAKALASGAFRGLDPSSADEDRAAGFVELEDRDGTSFAPGDVLHGAHALFSWRIDAIRVPAAQVKSELERWTAAYEKEHARLPSKAEKAERRDAIRDALRKRTAPTTRVLDVSWNLDAGQVQIWAASRKAVEEIAAAIESAFEVKLQPLTPGARAAAAGVADGALGPTPELVGGTLSRSEVRDEQA